MGKMIQRLHQVLVSPALRHGFVILGTTDVSIGRSRGCHVVLPSDEVSRIHAKVSSIDGRTHALADLKSRNGTFVNGERLSAHRRLEPHDEIAIGPFLMQFLVVEGTREELSLRFDVQPETNRWPLSRRFDPPLLAGTIAGDMLIEMCQLVELNRHSGVLRLECEGRAGILRFREGTLVGARFAAETGESAARLILAQERGRYVFDEEESEDEGRVNGIAVRASILALDVVRARDERARERRETRRRPALPGMSGGDEAPGSLLDMP